ncbi:SLBB domain-containing protein [Litoribacter ruber]|uniref:SLBB domain-containing protein n=1 Tax=Litoribacter ruber TaxID=702568 RepID=UPI00293D23C6|nr:SLBB domain-containing protein [Litoribacter ruber]
MKIRFIFLLALVASLIIQIPESFAQAMPDIATVRVDDLSDNEVRELIARGKAAGLSDQELLQMAESRGLPKAEVEKLRLRMEQLDLIGDSSTRTTTRTARREPRKQVDLEKISQGLLNQQGQVVRDQADLPIFGMDLFYNKERNLTFEPNLNLATPKNYILGPGDKLFIDIYGESEQNYEANVTPEGNLMLDNVGPVSVSGLSIEEATRRIKGRLQTYYPGMGGSNPTTFVQVSLGDVRTIKVHMVGELRLPGTFTLSAFSTVFNALYAAGGPNERGSMRNVKLIRNNREIARIDIYDFLMRGTADLNSQLQDQDVIMVEPFEARVQVAGEVKRPGIFEVKEGENLQSVMRYAGGFTDDAFTDRVSVVRNTPKEKTVSDIYREQFEMFTVKGGDRYYAGQLLDRFTNRVQIKGAVFREGNYAISDGMKLSDLIKRAEGLRGEAFLERATVLRTHEDLSTEVLQVNLSEVMAGQNDLTLQREDIVRVASIYDLTEEFYVKITGEVRNPGIFPFSKNMTVEDLLIFAGGVKEAASLSDVEIARRAAQDNARDISDIIATSVNRDLSPSASPVVLQPFDHVIIRRKPNFVLEKVIRIEGQVAAPGEFAVKNAEEKISDVIRRAGGLTEFAYPKGATLIRRTEFYETESERVRKQKNYENLLARISSESDDLTESQRRLLTRIGEDIKNYQEFTTELEEDLVVKSKVDVLSGITERKAEIAPLKIRETEAIAIDLEKILANPGSRHDLILEEGDIISIPKRLQTVRLRGDVIYPTTVKYEDNRSMSYFINRAGGFDNRAKRRRTYVVYANGEVARTKSFLGLRFYPSVEPGAEVIVPTKGPRIPFRPGEIISVTTGLATLALLLSQINFGGGE